MIYHACSYGVCLLSVTVSSNHGGSGTPLWYYIHVETFKINQSAGKRPLKAWKSAGKRPLKGSYVLKRERRSTADNSLNSWTTVYCRCVAVCRRRCRPAEQLDRSSPTTAAVATAFAVAAAVCRADAITVGVPTLIPEPVSLLNDFLRRYSPWTPSCTTRR